MKRSLFFVCGIASALCLGLLTAEAVATDWPMWGGTPARNMVSAVRNLPTSWDLDKKQNVKWSAKLGSQTYTTPVVAGGQVYVGTNNESPRNPKETGDRAVLMCFRESDGQFLWQHTHQKLEDSNQDWPETGLCSSPLVEGERLYYVSNRGEVLSLDTHGDGKGGSKVVWTYDMMKELGIVPHNKVSSSPAVHGDLIYVNTSNGPDENHEKTPRPNAPTLIAVDKKTGKLAWKAPAPGVRLYDGQWSSPAVGAIAGVVQVVIGGGDGWVRGYDAEKGAKLWEFDTNPKGVPPKAASIVIATPVIWENRVYVANGQDPESGQGPGSLFAIDGSKRGDLTTAGLVWRYGEIKRSISGVAIHEGMIFAADLNGFVHCLDAAKGKPYWTHDTMAAIWASPMVVDGKVYVGNADGDVFILEAAKQKKLLFQTNMGSNVYSTIVPANGTLFLTNRDTLFALAKK